MNHSNTPLFPFLELGKNKEAIDDFSRPLTPNIFAITETNTQAGFLKINKIFQKIALREKTNKHFNKILKAYKKTIKGMKLK